MSASDAVTVLFITGKGRSGSTLLDQLLGHVDGFFSAGELFRLWSWGFGDRVACGCGRPIPECPIWSAVAADPEVAAFEPRLVAAQERRTLRWSRLPLLLLAARRGVLPRDPAVRAFVAATAAVYRAITRVTGARVIVDSSKFAGHPTVLGLVPGIDARGLHLVRDPRAVAFSWQRRKSFAGGGNTDEMPRFGPLYSATSWLVRNAAVELAALSRPQVRWARLRYEDFMADPPATLAAVAAFAGRPAEVLPLTGQRSAAVVGGHAVGGNPGKFRTGTVELHEDRAWRTAMPLRHRLVTTAVTAPLLRRYGYPLLAVSGSDTAAEGSAATRSRE